MSHAHPRRKSEPCGLLSCKGCGRCRNKADAFALVWEEPFPGPFGASGDARIGRESGEWFLGRSYICAFRFRFRYPEHSPTVDPNQRVPGDPKSVGAATFMGEGTPDSAVEIVWAAARDSVSGGGLEPPRPLKGTSTSS